MSVLKKTFVELSVLIKLHELLLFFQNSICEYIFNFKYDWNKSVQDLWKDSIELNKKREIEPNKYNSNKLYYVIKKKNYYLLVNWISIRKRFIVLSTEGNERNREMNFFFNNLALNNFNSINYILTEFWTRGI